MTKLLMIFVTVISAASASTACNLVGGNMRYNGTNLSDNFASDPTNFYNQARSTSSIDSAQPTVRRRK
jgi:hypothetical protein